jgi:uncharacterized glyoxalase superfamily protein PhnB
MTIAFQAPIPLLRIFDVDKAREFYLEYLGFTVDWEHRFGDTFPIYMQISRAGLMFHLTEHHGDCCPGSTVFVWMSGIDEFHQELVSKNYPRLRPEIETTFYGAKCVQLHDPFGNRLRFNEKIPTEDAP